ncbi:class I SAM-dependent methyltransferase [Gordonia crocea]|uniref:S-adenosylmethionine-dependent methyltransferase n=1 Tax=Gordonia crocea TaxID=589162 RepID=A0A7I9V0S6_9ACTN|nr:class I SAM-dependent methyltransferase [Gordonia crocea]GED98762.1 S-adenosylmethionine-dependent methyltransferase [Gordonia crocea]
MGFYEDRILPHIIARTCGMPAMRKIRRKATAGLRGEVIEIGFGSGANVGCYPDEVTSVTAIEPSDTAWRMAADAVGRSAVPIIRGGLDGQRLPFDDDSFDAALSTYTMCTIADLPAALAELRRVVKPGGTLHFLEHGRAPDEKVRRWQRRLEPLQRRVGGGCHLTRDIPALLVDSGWEPVELEQDYAAKTPKAFGALSIGVARAAQPG